MVKEIELIGRNFKDRVVQSTPLMDRMGTDKDILCSNSKKQNKKDLLNRMHKRN